MKHAMTICQGPRENIEDAARTIQVHGLPNVKSNCSIFVVCDGVGGETGGEVASNLAASTAASHIAASIFSLGNELEVIDQVKTIVGRAICTAHEIIMEVAAQEPHLKGMATTIVCAVAMADRLIVGWAGDSRCCLYHNDHVRRLTHDHSRVQELLDHGLITPREIPDHPDAHRITRFVGQLIGIEPETAIADLHDGDVLLLTTDGLTDVLSDQQIAAVIRHHIDSESSEFGRFDDLPDRLVQRALDLGTTDNVTAVCGWYQISERSRRDLSRTMTNLPVSRIVRQLNLKMEETTHAII